MFVIHTIEVMLGRDNIDLYLESAEGPNNSFVFDIGSAMVFGTREEADKMLGHESLRSYRYIEVLELSAQEVGVK